MAVLTEKIREMEPRIRKKSENDFNTDYSRETTPCEIKEDAKYFVYEYRLEAQKVHFEYLLADSKIKDIYRSEEMSTKMQFALWERAIYGQSTRREEAELKGLLSLEKQLQTATPDDLIIWASPPGPKEENYGDYGFIFTGKIDDSGEQKKLRMTAVRLYKPSLEQFKQGFSRLTGEETELETAEQFLETTRVVKNLDQNTVDKILFDHFGFEEDPLKKIKDQAIIEEMDELGLLDDFVRIMQEGTVEEKENALNVIQNWVIERQKNWRTNERIIFPQIKIEMLVSQYGHTPPETRGSCPGSTSSSNVLNKLNNLNSLFNSNEWFTCPKCNYKAHGPIGNTCPGCGITKEQYAAEAGEDTCE